MTSGSRACEVHKLDSAVEVVYGEHDLGNVAMGLARVDGVGNPMNVDRFGEVVGYDDLRAIAGGGAGERIESFGIRLDLGHVIAPKSSLESACRSGGRLPPLAGGPPTPPGGRSLPGIRRRPSRIEPFPHSGRSWSSGGHRLRLRQGAAAGARSSPDRPRRTACGPSRPRPAPRRRGAVRRGTWLWPWAGTNRRGAGPPSPRPG